MGLWRLRCCHCSEQQHCVAVCAHGAGLGTIRVCVLACDLLSKQFVLVELWAESVSPILGVRNKWQVVCVAELAFVFTFVVCRANGGVAWTLQGVLCDCLKIHVPNRNWNCLSPLSEPM